ncbi:MAG: acetylglutamate kinase [Rikenellaceae bacterium]
MEKITVVKIGGNVIDNEVAFASFMERFAKLEGAKILIHGGGKIATRLAKDIGVETTMIEGRRVTDKAMLDIVTMTYAGLLNKQVVAALQMNGCNAIGLSGADANAIKATKRPANPIDFGFVGDIDPANVNSELLKVLLEAGITPVFCAIMHNGEGMLLNCNADTVASSVALGASRIAATDLIYCFEKRGVLSDVNDDNSVIELVTPANYPTLKADGVISDGMIPKIENALKAVAKGVKRVCIKHSDELLEQSGTSIME